MRILIPTIGTRGDVQPFIALAHGLIQAGHEVRLASHPAMKSLVESHTVAFTPIGPDIDFAKEVAAIRSRTRNAIFALIQAMRYGFELLEACHEDLLAECRTTELVIVPTAIATGKNEAELLKLPYLSVTFMPWAIPYHDPDRPFFKRIFYNAMDGLIHLVTTRPLNQIRKRQGLGPVGAEGFGSARLNLIPISPLVYAPNPLWETNHQLVGYWFTKDPRNWEPPASLVAFIEDGDSPVLVNLGAMSAGDDTTLETARLFIDAVQQVGLRAIIQGWDTAIRKLTLPGNIYPAGPLPHSWLLPHCSGIVHHGGFGTTAAGMQYGLPALVIPHIADQFYWGQRVYELEVGPRPIMRSKLNMQDVVIGLDELARNEKLSTTAYMLGQRIRSENGVEKAITLIEQTFK
jgi:sterol 3beta-glucosyltransferase